VPSRDRVAAAQAALLDWYGAYARALPWRRTTDPYAILVSEIMLQQTQVDRVIPKYFEFLGRFPSLASLAAASPAAVIRAWSPLGYNRRAVNLQRAALVVQRDFDGRLPSDPVALRSLPGIGEYTAAAVCCFAFGEDAAVVDTNVHRVLLRLTRQERLGDAAVRQLATHYLPSRRAADWNQALMDLGATICRAGAPLCLLCPLAEVCPSRGQAVRETRTHYAAGGRPERFRDSDRYLRGRIVDALRTAGALSTEALAGQLGLADEEGGARLARLITALERDGLLTNCGPDYALHCLPD